MTDNLKLLNHMTIAQLVANIDGPKVQRTLALRIATRSATLDDKEYVVFSDNSYILYDLHAMKYSEGSLNEIGVNFDNEVQL